VRSTIICNRRKKKNKPVDVRNEETAPKLGDSLKKKGAEAGRGEGIFPG